MRFKLRMGVSGRHCHLKREDMDILFGKGSELHPIKPIVQPGQFTCEEKIILVTDKAARSVYLRRKNYSGNG